MSVYKCYLNFFYKRKSLNFRHLKMEYSSTVAQLAVFMCPGKSFDPKYLCRHILHLRYVVGLAVNESSVV